MPSTKPRITPEEHKRRETDPNWTWYQNRWRKKSYVIIKRKPRFCEACGKQLRENYKKDDRVCSHPKMHGKTQSKCQLWKQRKDRRIQVRHCAVCNEELHNPYANQKYCQLPEGKTPCEIAGQKIAESNRKSKNFKGHSNQNVPAKEKEEKVLTKRRCLGVLATEEKGDHYFMSESLFNRICPDCSNALQERKTDTYSFSDASKHREDE